MNLLEKINDINLELKEVLSEKFEDELKDFYQFKTKLESKIKENKTENENIKIGIVGQVKAGKSSFVNALFFDGEDILPKAATPMTAALTNIKYGEKIKVEVNFFSESDWDIVEKNIKSYNKIYEEKEKDLIESSTNPFNTDRNEGLKIDKEELKLEIEKQIPEEILACKEIYDLFEKNNLSKEQFGKTEILEGIYSLENLNDKLNNYVGVTGKYTPIVKNTVIYINNERLRGIEIIDTPGTNDPIISRGRITREYLSTCDAVFMLSYSSEFLGNEDMNFLLRTLPGEGITTGFLVASKFDLVLQDQTIGKGDFKIAYKETAKQLNARAKKTFEEILTIDPDNKIIKKLYSQLPPLFISSMAFNIYKKFETIERHKSEKFYYGLLTDKYKTFDFTKERLLDLSGIKEIQDKILNTLRDNKNKIISEKIIDLEKGQVKVFEDKLSKLKNTIEYKINVLKTKDIKELQANHSLIISNLKSAENQIKIDFNNVMKTLKSKIYELDIELENQANNEKYFYYTVETRTREEYTGSSGHLWWKEEHYRTEYYKTANTNESVDKSSLYLSDAINLIKQTLFKIIDEDTIIKNLKKTIVETIYSSNSIEFNSSEIELSISQTLNTLNIPEINIDRNLLLEVIDSEFSKEFIIGSDVEGSNINNLKKTQRSIQHKLKDLLLNNFIKQYEETIKNKVNGLESSIIINFRNKLNKDLEDLSFQLNDSENNIFHFEKIIETLNLVTKKTR